MKNTKVNLNSFWEFSKGLNLVLGRNALSESARYIKSNNMLYRYVFIMSALGKSSFLAMDQSGRLAKYQGLFKLKRFTNRRLRHTVISDSTIIERLGVISCREVRRKNYDVLRAGIESGIIRRTAIVDGTQLGGKLYSCLCFLTRWWDVLLVDCEPIEKQGKELLSSERLIRRCCEYIGKGKIKYLLADMLYFTERFWGLREEGYIGDLIIKYTPDSVEKWEKPYRRLLGHFEELVALYNRGDKDEKDERHLYRMGFEHRRGVDKGSGIRYEIYYARHNSYDNRYQVARVVESPTRKVEGVGFYVITTSGQLSAEEMRQYGHGRWCIENDGFKMLNAHVESKRCWNKNETVLTNMVLIWMVAFGLLTLYRRENGYRIGRKYHQVKVTLVFVAQLLEVQSFGRFSLADNQ
jgi:hypothetical protein